MTSNNVAELITNLYDTEVTRLKHTATFVTVAYGMRMYNVYNALLSAILVQLFYFSRIAVVRTA